MKKLGVEKVNTELKQLKDLNNDLRETCNAHFVDNESLKGTPLHMAHHMVKAYDINENCTFFAISEPAFYGKIKKQQKQGRPEKQDI